MPRSATASANGVVLGHIVVEHRRDSIWGDVGLNISELRGSSSRYFRPLRSSKSPFGDGQILYPGLHLIPGTSLHASTVSRCRSRALLGTV
jgi:hypothetical protein